MAGWVLSVRHRYITELIYASDNVGKGHWSRFHRFFSHNAWDLDAVCLTLASLLMDAFYPLDAIVILALDDTLCRKRGLNLFGAGMHHDPLLSSKALKLVSWGHNWVVLALILVCPSWAPTKVFALPLGFRLYRNRQGNNKGKKNKKNKASRGQTPNKKTKTQKAQPKKNSQSTEPHRTRPELGLELINLLAKAFPRRLFVVTADSLYGGQSVLAHLPANVHFISRVHPQGVLYAPAPPASAGQHGGKRRKGERAHANP